MKRAQVKLWGSAIGAVVWDETRNLGVFEYARHFLRSGIEVAPLAVPLRSGVFDFPELAWRTFKGFPELVGKPARQVRQPAHRSLAPPSRGDPLTA